MKKGDYIFVYGTLRRGERADLNASQKAFDVKFVGTDSINGLLFNLGSYPGLKLITNPGDEFRSSHDSIVGDLFKVMDASITAVLDAYEGYPVLYNRCQVETLSGKTAWVYTYNPEVPFDQVITSGDWRNRR